jgi:plasmid maintenance system killer protein
MDGPDDEWLALRLSELTKNETHMRQMPRPHHESLEDNGMQLVALHAFKNERLCSDHLVAYMRKIGTGDPLSVYEQDHYVRALSTLVHCNGVSGVPRENSMSAFPLCPFDYAVKNLASDVRERYGIGKTRSTLEVAPF